MRHLPAVLFPACAAVVLAACAPEVQRASGAELYASYCASCHGPSGRGDGQAAAGQSPRPADLTRLARDNGGVFPLVSVMSKIDGYKGGPAGMPEFGPALEGPTVLVDTGDGVMTPTPEPLAALAEHLRLLQR